jgi:hypothetical protein
MVSRSRRLFRARFAIKFPLSEFRGRRESRVRAAPAVSRARLGKETHTSIQVQRRQSGLPCAMVLTASFVLSPATGLSCHCHPRKFPSANLTPASGRQDHTTSPSASAPFVQQRLRVHRIPFRVDDVGQRPSVGKDARTSAPDLPDGTSEIFLDAWLDTPQSQGRSDLLVGQIKARRLSLRGATATVLHPPLEGRAIAYG